MSKNKNLELVDTIKTNSFFSAEIYLNKTNNKYYLEVFYTGGYLDIFDSKYQDEFNSLDEAVDYFYEEFVD